MIVFLRVAVQFRVQVMALSIDSAFPADLERRLEALGVIAVLVVDEAADAVPLARALLDGGVGGIELTLRTDVALEAVRRIRAEVPELLVGVGTILTPAQVDQTLAAGGQFGVAPGMNPKTVAAARHRGLPFAPGVCTPTDIELALEAGCTTLKFFPCEPSGGLPYLRSIAAPFAHLGVRFVPLGGIDAGNAETYLREPLVRAIGGSWLAPRDVIRARDWTEVTRRAAGAVAGVRRVRGEVHSGGSDR